MKAIVRLSVAFGCCAVMIITSHGCGMQEPAITPVISIQASLSERVTRLTLWALAPRRHDNVMLTCQDLAMRRINPLDATTVEVLATTSVAFDQSSGPRNLSLDGVRAGPARLVYVAVYDATGLVIGNGCEADIEVGAGSVVSRRVMVYAVP